MGRDGLADVLVGLIDLIMPTAASMQFRKESTLMCTHAHFVCCAEQLLFQVSCVGRSQKGGRQMGGLQTLAQVLANT